MPKETTTTLSVLVNPGIVNTAVINIGMSRLACCIPTSHEDHAAAHINECKGDALEIIDVLREHLPPQTWVEIVRLCKETGT